MHKNKTSLPRDKKVSDASAIVDDCARWSGALWSKAHAGLGDTQEAAMYRAANRYGIEPNVFWAPRYRKPKDVLASVYLKLKAAYENECERQEARLRHELELAKALQGSASLEAAISEAEATLGSQKGETE